MVAKVRKQILSSRVQLLTTCRQLVAIIAQYQELLVIVFLKEDPRAFRCSNPDAHARGDQRLPFTVTCVRHVNEAGARGYCSFRHELRKSPRMLGRNVTG
jgi:hypothetical protein